MKVNVKCTDHLNIMKGDMESKVHLLIIMNVSLYYQTY